MQKHVCNTCGEAGYTAATQPEDLAKLPCPHCGSLPSKPSWQIVDEVIGQVISLFEPLR